MENTNRSVFSLSGVTGMLIATILLLSILVGLTVWDIKAQRKVANKPYTIKNPQTLKVRSKNDFNHKVIVK